jgi:MFS family permease
MVGFATGPLLAGALHVSFGFNAAFLAGAGFLTMAWLLIHFTVRETGKPPTPERTPVAHKTRPSATTLALMFGTIVMAGSLAMISALENEFNDRLDQTALGFGIAFSALTLARLVVQIPLGRLSDRIGRKMLIVGGLVALMPVTILFGYVQTTLQLVGLRVVQGVVTACVAAPAFALAADLATKGGEGREMSFVTMGFGLGLGLGPLIAGVLGGYAGFEVPFFVVGVLSLASAVMIWVRAEESITFEPLSVDEA